MISVVRLKPCTRLPRQGGGDYSVLYAFFCLMLAVLPLAGCGSKSAMESFLRDEVDLGYVTRVAVAPFENNSKEQFAPERVRGIAITEVLAQGLFDVVDKGLVDSAFREEAIDLSKGPMDAAAMKRLGQRLNVQAFLMGAIDHAGDVQRGQNSYPELGLTLRLVDVNSGMIFWHASGNESGNSLGKRLFGVGSDDDFKVSLRLLRKLLASISSERKVKLPVATAGAPAVVVPAAEATPRREDPAKDVMPEPVLPQDAAPMGEEETLAPAETSPTELQQEMAPATVTQPQEAPTAEDDDMKPDESVPAPAPAAAEAKPAAAPSKPAAEQPARPAPAAEAAPSLQLDQAWPE